jgi:hypothetical protein
MVGDLDKKFMHNEVDETRDSEVLQILSVLPLAAHTKPTDRS